MVALIALAHAATPAFVVTARVLDADGAAVSGDHAITVSVYDEVADADPAWSDVFVATLADGYVSVELGTDGSLPDDLFADGTAWLAVALDGTEPPRTPLVPVPVALRMDRVPALPAEPVDCDAAARGRMYLNTTDGLLRVCAQPPEWSRL